MLTLLEPVRLIDLILVAAVAELCVLYVWLPRSGRDLRLVDLLPNLVAGFALLVAIKLAVSDAPWFWFALCLAVALLAHILDLRQRSRQRGH